MVACYYAGGELTGETNVGGIMGYRSAGNISACYWSGNALKGISGMNPVTATHVTNEEEWNDAISKDNGTGLNGSANTSGYTFSGTMDAPSSLFLSNAGSPALLTFPLGLFCSARLFCAAAPPPNACLLPCPAFPPVPVPKPD